MANSIKRKRRLWDAYAFQGFRPLHTVRGVFGDPKARVITLVRRSKKTPVGPVVACTRAGTTAVRGWLAICPAPTAAFISSSKCDACCARVVAK